MNVAVTEAFAVMLTLHALVPLQLPDHPANVDPELGAAFSVTAVPLANVEVQVDPQLMPAGLLVTAPVPVPAPFTDSWKFEAGGLEFTWVELHPNTADKSNPRHKNK